MNASNFTSLDCCVRLHVAIDQLDYFPIGQFFLSSNTQEAPLFHYQKSICPHNKAHTLIRFQCQHSTPLTLQYRLPHTHPAQHHIHPTLHGKITPSPIEQQYIHAEFTTAFVGIVLTEYGDPQYAQTQPTTGEHLGNEHLENQHLDNRPSADCRLKNNPNGKAQPQGKSSEVTRFGLPCDGYIYHFIAGKIFQVYQVQANGTLLLTSSTPQRLDYQLITDAAVNCLLVPLRIGKKSFQDQHLLHQRTPIAENFLAEIDSSWLNQHAYPFSATQLRHCQHHTGPSPNQSSVGPVPRFLYQLHADQQQPISSSHRARIKEKNNLSSLQADKQHLIDERHPWYLAHFPALNTEKSLCSTPTNKRPYFIAPQHQWPRQTAAAISTLSTARYHYYHRYIAPQLHGLWPLQWFPDQCLIIQAGARRTFRVGVFFDGTGHHRLTDTLKAKQGNKSVTNIAKLFSCYPQVAGYSAAIYVSGIGTQELEDSDQAQRWEKVLQQEDEEASIQAFGVSFNGILGQTGGWEKWQQLIDSLHNLLTSEPDYQQFTDVSFDILGFSRGAALARHLISALEMGLPDYQQPVTDPFTPTISPHLLSRLDTPRAERQAFFSVDQNHSVDIRFVGLFDTVASFYGLGDVENRDFKMDFSAQTVHQAVQLIAAHEYRHYFPLVSLMLDHPRCYQELFPGSHTDIGGGYVAKSMYFRQDIDPLFGQPVDGSYYLDEDINKRFDLELEKQRLEQLTPEQSPTYSITESLNNYVQQEQDQWQQYIHQQWNHQACIKKEDNTLYYYHLHPLGNGLAGLTLARMYQLATWGGIHWQQPLANIDLEDFTTDPLLLAFWQSIQWLAPGCVQFSSWQQLEGQLLQDYIHRPYETAVLAGYTSVMTKLVNQPETNAQSQFTRKVISVQSTRSGPS